MHFSKTTGRSHGILHVIVRIFATICKLLVAYTLVFPAFFIATVINETIRLFVSVSLIGSKYKLFGVGLSNMFYFAGPDTGGINLVTLVSPGEADLERERSRLLKILRKQTKTGKKSFGRLTQSLSCKQGYGCWKDTESDFDIRKHVKMYDLSQPGEGRKYFTQQELLDEILPQLWTYMDCGESRPHWEWLIVNRVLMPDGFRCFRIFRFHHAYMDGVACAMFLAWENMDQPCPPWVVDLSRPLSARENFFLLLSKIQGALSVPLFILQAFLNSGNNQRSLENDPFLAENSTRKLTMRFTDRLPAENFRKLKNKYGGKASITSIVTSAIRTALATLAKNRGIKDGTMNLSLPGAVPRYPDGTPRTRLSFVKVHEPLGAPGNDMDLVKIPGSQDLLSAYFLLRWMDRFPRPVFDLMGKFQGRAFISTMFNNMPYLRKLSSIDGGSLVEEVMIWTHPKKPVGLQLTGMRYGDNVRFYTATDDSVFSPEEVKLFINVFTEQLSLKEEWEETDKKPHSPELV